MPKLNKTQSQNHLYWFYFFAGKFPPGTDRENFAKLKMSELQVDDPALPSDPHFEKKRLSLELQLSFFRLGYTLPSPLAQMKKRTLELGDFATWCWTNHKEA